MKTIISTLALCLCAYMTVDGQSVAINSTGNSPDSSAMLDIQSTTQGVLVPRMNSLARDSISNPSEGLLVYDLDTKSFWYFQSGSWVDLNYVNRVFENNNMTIRNTGDHTVENFVFGSPSIESTANMSENARFFFNKEKRAFRAGSPRDIYLGIFDVGDSTLWDNDNLGLYSFAAGLGTVASGNGAGATALGFLTEASGDIGATALGFRTTASGNSGAIAMGTHATASGSNTPIAIGRRVSASGADNAIAIGHYVESAGITSITIGEGRTFSSDTLVNNIDHSLMVGFRSDIPTFFVGPSSGLAGSIGKVGIGTSTPDAVISNARLAVKDGHIVISNDYGLLSINSSNDGFGAGIDTDSEDNLHLLAGGATVLTTTNSGQVGIGTSSPDATLDVVGSIRSSNGVVFAQEGAQTIVMNPNEGANYVQLDVGGTGHTNDAIILGHAGDLHNRIGIGTTSPDVDLEISDGGSSYLRVTSTDNSQIGIDLVRAGTSNSDFRIANNGGILEFQQSLDINGSTPTALLGLTTVASRPNATALNLDLGISGKRWRDVYITGGVMSSSDRRLKQEIESIQYGLNEVLKLKPVQYTWKSNPEKEDLGLIAQDVERVIPQVVGTPQNSDDHYSINYTELIPVMIKAIQELSEQVDALKTENNKLQTSLANQGSGK